MEQLNLFPAPEISLDDLKQDSIILWNGVERKIIEIVKIGKELKYNIDLGNNKNIWTNFVQLQKELTK